MGLSAILTPGANETTDQRARCRNCGYYYDPDRETCPDCGSGNKLRAGPPDGQQPH
jgi:rRNA maturation endonuclease Nob1